MTIIEPTIRTAEDYNREIAREIKARIRVLKAEKKVLQDAQARIAEINELLAVARADLATFIDKLPPGDPDLTE